jgi:gluconate 2-dehydrogenase gamma chain
MNDKHRGPTRRQFLGSLSGTAVAAVLPIASAPLTLAQASESAYQPTYLTGPEWSFLNAAVLRLIPAEEDGPDGVSAGVPEFIDRQLELPYGHGAYSYMQGPYLPDAPAALGYQYRYTPRELYRLGIAGADGACRKKFGKPFAELPSDDQDQFLTALEHNTVAMEGPPAAVFFAQLLRNVREGYFADPMYGGNRHMAGWKLIGFPGARADFTDWLDQQGKPYPYGPVPVRGSKDA